MTPVELQELKDKNTPLSDLLNKPETLKQVFFKPEFNHLILVKDSPSPAKL